MNTAPLVPLFPAEGDVLLDKYAVERVIGEGGMGAVLRAQHVLRRVPVALKFIHPNVLAIPGAVERFYNEAVAASRIANEHVVQILDVDRMPSGVPFIVMEFLGVATSRAFSTRPPVTRFPCRARCTSRSRRSARSRRPTAPASCTAT